MTHPIHTLATGQVCRPHFSQPGSLAEQVRAVNLYLRLPPRLKRDRAERAHAWQVVRALAMPHAGRD